MNTFSSPRSSRTAAGSPSHRTASPGHAARTGTRTGGRPALPAPRTTDTAGAAAEGTGGFAAALRGGLTALPLTLLCGIILLLAAAAAAYADSDPDRMITPLGLGALALTALIGGVISVRLGRGAPVLCGLCGGIPFTLALFILSLLFSDPVRASVTLGLPGPAVLGLHAAVAAVEVIGALLGRRRAHPTAHLRHGSDHR